MQLRQKAHQENYLFFYWASVLETELKPISKTTDWLINLNILFP